MKEEGNAMQRPNQMTQTVEYSSSAQQCFFLLLLMSCPKEPVIFSVLWIFKLSCDMDDMYETLCIESFLWQWPKKRRELIDANFPVLRDLFLVFGS